MLAVAPARAQSDEGSVAASPESGTTVEALIEHGVSLREQGHDEEAVVVFRQAREAEDSPRVRTQLGLALLASGEFVEAFELLSQALREPDAWVEARHDAIEASFLSASQHVGLLEITGGEPGAEVSVNGRVVGAFPLSHAIHTLVGRAVVEVALEGYHRFSTEVAVEPGQTARLRVALVPRAEDEPGGGGSSNDDWILPVAIIGGVLVIGGAVTAVAFALQPGYEHSDVGGVVMTLSWP